ncbi:hypothetical protein PR048_020578 [Dryococelus australis]|uniref:Uncharacterized protein n=1 Tax=Dryococelus australis TaxID=614101 RepID=A0ABQ9H6S5_9NEOP|nr:hypothetical protein PR048_020578 [Dryococelus australis]
MISFLRCWWDFLPRPRTKDDEHAQTSNSGRHSLSALIRLLISNLGAVSNRCNVTFKMETDVKQPLKSSERAKLSWDGHRARGCSLAGNWPRLEDQRKGDESASAMGTMAAWVRRAFRNSSRLQVVDRGSPGSGVAGNMPIPAHELTSRCESVVVVDIGKMASSVRDGEVYLLDVAERSRRGGGSRGAERCEVNPMSAFTPRPADSPPPLVRPGCLAFPTRTSYFGGGGGCGTPKELSPPSPMDWRSWHWRRRVKMESKPGGPASSVAVSTAVLIRLHGSINSYSTSKGACAHMMTGIDAGGVLSATIHISYDLISFHSASNQQKLQKHMPAKWRRWPPTRQYTVRRSEPADPLISLKPRQQGKFRSMEQRMRDEVRSRSLAQPIRGRGNANFSEALLKFYFQDIPPPRANKAHVSLENYTKGTTHRILQRNDGNTARLARRSDAALGVSVSVAPIAPSLLNLGRGVPKGSNGPACQSHTSVHETRSRRFPFHLSPSTPLVVYRRNSATYPVNNSRAGVPSHNLYSSGFHLESSMRPELRSETQYNQRQQRVPHKGYRVGSLFGNRFVALALARACDSKHSTDFLQPLSYNFCPSLPLARAGCETASTQTTRFPPRRTGIDSRRVRSRILACGIRAGRCRWPACFLGDLPFPRPLNFGAVPYSLHFALVVSQDLYVKSCPNLFALFTHFVFDSKSVKKLRMDYIHCDFQLFGKFAFLYDEVRVETREAPQVLFPVYWQRIHPPTVNRSYSPDKTPFGGMEGGGTTVPYICSLESNSHSTGPKRSRDLRAPHVQLALYSSGTTTSRPFTPQTPRVLSSFTLRHRPMLHQTLPQNRTSARWLPQRLPTLQSAKYYKQLTISYQAMIGERRCVIFLDNDVILLACAAVANGRKGCFISSFRRLLEMLRPQVGSSSACLKDHGRLLFTQFFCELVLRLVFCLSRQRSASVTLLSLGAFWAQITPRPCYAQCTLAMRWNRYPTLACKEITDRVVFAALQAMSVVEYAEVLRANYGNLGSKARLTIYSHGCDEIAARKFRAFHTEAMEHLMRVRQDLQQPVAFVRHTFVRPSPSRAIHNQTSYVRRKLKLAKALTEGRTDRINGHL